jgi:energy-coupling factor transport system permease protein
MGYSITTVHFKIYELGLYNGAFFFMRIFLVIMLSTVLTLTTKPTDLTSAIEWFLHPLTFLKINVSIFAMIISLALRFIPTLFNETQKILKAQSSRGVDFKEGTLKQQIGQIISLLIPMLVISFKRAADLADAMEARGYIPGAIRTKLNIMKFNVKDIFGFVFSIGVFISALLFMVI